MKHIPRKRFGQNFLIDGNVISKIVNTINPKKEEIILEIGPGLGALTFPIMMRCHKLYAVELDRDVIPFLKAQAKTVGDLTLIESDILKFKFESYFPKDSKVRCIGNLPYNISTPIIFHLLEQRQWVKDMHFMLQKEMVDRITAEPNCKTYGRLSVMVQYYCKVEKLFLVRPNSFDPPPKVDSAIIYLKPHEKIIYPAKDENKFSIIVREAFNQRRKTISNSLKKIIGNDIFTEIGLDPKLRAEQLSVKDFVTISNVSQF